MADIVLAYGEWKGTTGEYIASAFRALGHQVSVLPLQRFRRGKINIAFRFLEKTAPLISWVDARRWLKANKLSPDLFLWVESPRFVEVRIARPFPCPTAAYVIDTHTQGTALRALSRQYDKVFVAQKGDAAAFASEGFDARWLPLAADKDIHAHLDRPKEFDIGFVGNIESARYKERFQLLRQLSGEFSVHLAKAYGLDMALEYARCRVGFNKSLKGDLNMRVFEVMCMGVPLVTDRIANGQNELFVEGRHFLAYDGWVSLREAARSIINDDTRGRSLAAAARAEVLEKHLYVHRAKEIISAALSHAVAD